MTPSHEKALRRRRALRMSIASAILFLLSCAIYLLARFAPGLMFPWYQDLSATLLGLWSHLTDLFPFSLLEWGILGAVWLVLGWVIRLIVSRKSPILLFSTAVNVSAVLVFLFVALWGADQFAPTFLSTTPYQEHSYTVEQAEAAADYLLQMANYWSGEVPSDSSGVSDFGSFSDMESGLESGYRWLEDTYGSRFAIGNVTAKPMTFSYLMDCIGLTGIYTAYTGEMNINADTPDQSLPYVMSHECAHRTTVTQENDANFVAFLACIHSDLAIYQYSGWYSAFIYVYNAISKVDKDAQSRLWSAMNDRVKADVLAANAHYAAFSTGTRGRVKKAAENLNSSYLKTFNQSDGINNYGAVAGSIIAWYWLEVAGSGQSAG